MPLRISRGKEGEHYLLTHLVGSEKSLRRFLTSYPTEIQGVSRKGATVSLRVILPESVLARTRGSGVTYVVELDITQAGAQAQAIESTEPVEFTRSGLGLTTTQPRYLFCPEVTAATQKLANDFPQLCSLVGGPVLANTCKGTPCHALAISKAAPAGAPAIVILGGIHGLELGSCEIALNFAEQLMVAHSTNTGVTIGTANFTHAQIAALLTSRQVVVFPMVNPDGRAYAQWVGGNPGWRKNRNPDMQIVGNPLSVGVDINRNFDFLFNLGTAFKPGCGLMVSDRPENDCYQGPKPFSEIESQNVEALLKQFPSTSWLLDLHSSSQTIMRPWTDDQTQSLHLDQTFMNPLKDLERGFPSDGYGEHMVANDMAEHDRLMNVLAQHISAAGGPAYSLKTGYEFSPSSGTSHDFAYSRHLAQPQNFGKILSFVVEWGETSRPTWAPDMQSIISEVTAGLLGFAVATQHPLP